MRLMDKAALRASQGPVLKAGTRRVDALDRCATLAPKTAGPLLSEAEHFRRCPLCGGYVDMRDRIWIDEH